MAITGDGSQEYPWLVHSYDELKTATTDRTYIPAYGKSWIALDADINCNDYGADFEWETINLGFTGTSYVPYGACSFDLNGHTIKNVPLKLNNSMFNANFTASNAGVAEFKGNGKILNVFTQPSSTEPIIRGYYNTANTTNIISNLSLSACLGSDTTAAFANEMLDSCAIYIESPKLSNVYGVICTFTSGKLSQSAIKNCDFDINVSDLRGQLFGCEGGVTMSTKVLDNCRITGKCKGDNLQSHIILNYCATNCVIALDLSEAKYANGTYDTAKNLFAYGGVSSDGVVVWEFRPINQYQNAEVYASGMALVSESEMKNGNALRAAGFTVVNVVGD